MSDGFESDISCSCRTYLSDYPGPAGESFAAAPCFSCVLQIPDQCFISAISSRCVSMMPSANSLTRGPEMFALSLAPGQPRAEERLLGAPTYAAGSHPSCITCHTWS